MIDVIGSGCCVWNAVSVKTLFLRARNFFWRAEYFSGARKEKTRFRWKSLNFRIPRRFSIYLRRLCQNYFCRRAASNLFRARNFRYIDSCSPFVSKLFFPARRSKSVPRAEFSIYRFLLADRVKTVFSGAAPENNSARHFFDISIFLRAENIIYLNELIKQWSNEWEFEYEQIQ